jgi:hypothetical protein
MREKQEEALPLTAASNEYRGPSARLCDAAGRVCCSAELNVNRARGATLALFTAEGERAWAPGWDPAFPVPERTEGASAVFVTGHAEETTTWVMVD